MRWYVYAYTDPRTDETFYVGKGKETRCYVHLKKRGRNKRMINRVSDIQRSGADPLITFVSFHDNELDAYNSEQVLITKLGRIEDGGKLLNLTLGGLGTKALNHKENPKFMAACYRNADAVNQNPEAVAKRVKFLKEYSKRPGVGEMRKELTKKMHEDPERSAAMQAGLQKGNTPEMRAARTEMMKAKYADPIWNQARIEKAVASRLRNKLSREAAEREGIK